MSTSSPDIAADAHPPASPEAPDAPVRGSVLVVDDERGPRESLRMILSGPYEVLTAPDGTSALETLRTREIDLVTVDLKMPGMKGDELIRAIRSELPQIEIIVITGCRSVETAVEGIRHGVFDYLTKPFDVVQVLASVDRALTRRQSRLRMVSFLERLGRMLGRSRDVEVVLDELEASPLAQERLRAMIEEPVLRPETGRRGLDGPSTHEFLETLAETIESRDATLRGHARRVAFYADLLADRLCLARQEREHVRMAAFLHDIGKVGAPSDVLEGRGEVPALEHPSIRAHAEVGERLLRPLGLGSSVGQIVRHHHERFDGAGYPDRLAGEEIPLASRIIAVADAFDAMTCARPAGLEQPERPTRTRDEAVEELRREAGGQFDPALVEVFGRIIEAGAEAHLDASLGFGETEEPSLASLLALGGDAA